MIFALLCIQLLLGGTSQAEVGFHFLDDSAPEAVTKNQRFVFQMLAPSGKEVDVNIEGEDAESLAEIAESRSEGRWRPELRSRLILGQFLLCQKQERKICPILEGIKVSTAFLMKNPRVVVASYHGLEELAESVSKREESLAGTRLPILLLNESGDIVKEGLTVQRLFSPDKNDGADLSLFAPGDLEGGIPLSSGLKPEEETYALGFPAATFTRGLHGKKDAVTDRLSYTKGRLKTGFSLSSLFSKDGFLRTDHDGNGGLSGGPVLNGNGEVAAVVARGIFDDQEKAPSALLSSDLSAWITQIEI